MFNFNSHKTLERTEYFRRNQFSSEHFKMHHNTSECIFYRKEIVATHLQSDKKKEDHQKRWQTWKMDSGDGVFSFKCVCTEKASCWWVVKRIIIYLYFINFLWHKRNSNFFTEKTWKPHIFNPSKRRSSVKKDGKPGIWLIDISKPHIFNPTKRKKIISQKRR